MDNPPKLFVVHRTPLEALASNLSSFAVFASLIGLGVYLESAAMQWLGAIVALIVVARVGIEYRSKNMFSIEGARKRLDEIERGHSSK